MVNLDVEELRPKLDLENKYVDFNSIRTAVSVLTLVGSLEIKVTDPTKDGECRGKCPKCDKDRAFALNVNTNRFNCFNKGCVFKGGGVIDFISKLFEVTAKEASHLLACAYGIQPYHTDQSGIDKPKIPAPKKQSENAKPEKVENKTAAKAGDYVKRSEFEKLQNEFERFKNVVYAYILENDIPIFDTPETEGITADQIQ